MAGNQRFTPGGETGFRLRCVDMSEWKADAAVDVWRMEHNGRVWLLGPNGGAADPDADWALWAQDDEDERVVIVKPRSFARASMQATALATSGLLPDEAWKRDAGPFKGEEQAWTQWEAATHGLPPHMKAALGPGLMIREATLAVKARLTNYESAVVAALTPEQAVVIAGLLFRVGRPDLFDDAWTWVGLEDEGYWRRRTRFGEWLLAWDRETWWLWSLAARNSKFALDERSGSAKRAAAEADRMIADLESDVSANSGD